MTKSFKVTNKEEELDLLQAIERELPEARWGTGAKPTKWLISEIFDFFPYVIVIGENLIGWRFLKEEPSAPNWQIGQSIPQSALEQLLEIPENPDGSITISKELQAQLVMEGRLK